LTKKSNLIGRLSYDLLMIL